MAFRRGEVGNVLEQRGVAMGPHLGVTELALVPAFHLAAQLLRHGLHAVADAQHRHAQLEHSLRGLVGRFLVDAGMAAGKNHAFELAVGRVLAHPVVRHITRMHLAVNVGLAHTPRDQLGHLGAEIEDEDLLVLHGYKKG